MKSDIDTQLNEILKRSVKIKHRKVCTTQIIKNSVIAVACLALIVVTALFMPQFTENKPTGEISHYGSLIVSAPFMGYVVIGILAFILGITITLLCSKVKELKEEG